jgi:hypothetical protein
MHATAAAERFLGQVDKDVADKVLMALQGIRYGSVEIIIHDSRVVQIERKEKVRIEAAR